MSAARRLCPVCVRPTTRTLMPPDRESGSVIALLTRLAGHARPARALHSLYLHDETGTTACPPENTDAPA